MDLSRDSRWVLAAESEAIGMTKGKELALFDLVEGKSRLLSTHGRSVSGVAFHPSGRWIASGDMNGVLRVGPLTGEEPHVLLRQEGYIMEVAFSPDGRWVATTGSDGAIRLWPMPDMDQTPFHLLPHEEVLAKLRSLTNLRVVEDDEAVTGYKVEAGPFPGWKEVPTW